MRATKVIVVLMLALLCLSIVPLTPVGAQALDFTAQNHCDASFSCAVSVSTASHDALVVMCSTDAIAGAYTITDSQSLSWTNRGTFVNGIFPGVSEFTEQWAIAASSMGDTITCSSSLGDMTVMVMAISGVYNFMDSSVDWDSNGALPATNVGSGSSATCTLSTSNAHDFLIGWENTNATTLSSAPSGWTEAVSSTSGNPFMDSAYKEVSTTQSSVTETFTLSGSDNWGTYCDAIEIPAPAPQNADAGNILQVSTSTTQEVSYVHTSLGHIDNASDLIVVAYSFGYGVAPFPGSPHDNESNSYTLASSQTLNPCFGATTECKTAIYYTTAPSINGVNVSVTGVGDNTGFAITVWETSGLNASDITAASNTGSSGCCSVGSTSVPAGGMIFAAAATDDTDVVHTLLAGSGFNQGAQGPGGGGGPALVATEYAISYGSTHTTAPFVITSGAGINWAEAAAVFSPVSHSETTCPLTSNVDNYSWAEYCLLLPPSTTVSIPHQNQTVNQGATTAVCHLTVANTGDIVVMAIVNAKNAQSPRLHVSSVADTFSDSFTTNTTKVAALAQNTGVFWSDQIFVSYATTGSSGADTITATLSASSTSTTICYDVVGATTTSASSAVGYGSGESMGTGTLPTWSGPGLIAIAVQYKLNSSSTSVGAFFTAGTGFTLQDSNTISVRGGDSYVSVSSEYQPEASTTPSGEGCGNVVTNYGVDAATVSATITPATTGDLVVALFGSYSPSSGTANTISSVTGGSLTWNAIGTGSTQTVSTTAAAMYAYYATASGTSPITVSVASVHGATNFEYLVLYDLVGVTASSITHSAGSGSSSGSFAAVSSFSASGDIVLAGVDGINNGGVFMPDPGYFLPSTAYQINNIPTSYYGASQCNTVSGATTAPFHSNLQTGSAWTGYAEYAVSFGTSSYQNITVETNPVDLTNGVIIDGMAYSTTQTFSWVVGSSHNLTAALTSGSYHFTAWSDSGARSHNITVPSSPTTYIADFHIPGMVIETIWQTSPGSLQNALTINGTLYLHTPVIIYADSGSSYVVSAAATALGPGLVSLNFSSWSDGGTRVHTYFPTVNATVTARYLSGSACTGQNLNHLLNSGCVWGAGFYYWFGIFGPWILCFFEFLPALGVYIRTESPMAGIAVYVVLYIIITGGLSVTVLPASLSSVGPGLLGLGVAGSIFQLLRSSKGG